MLRVLKLRELPRLSNCALGVVAAACRWLTELDVGGCDQVGLAGLTPVLAACTGLAFLGLARCQKVDDRLIRKLASRSLVDLDLGGCARVTDAGLVPLAANCPILVNVGVDECPLVTSVGRRLFRGTPNAPPA